MDNNGKPRQAAPGIRSTLSFIIFLDNVLGQGATSKVYVGRHKKSGKRVACKVPSMPTVFRGVDMERESQVLLKLKHPNIVCLEARETDQISKESILIMELCTGGSLYDVLEKPEHAHGLQEKVFLQVLNDITCGMKYLRDNHLVHRDVKPGNIMCFLDGNGKTIYKLADFGAARELTDDENFTSLHGTEEYLHPDIFEKAVLKKRGGAAFDASVDLWSIGVTLYHIVTGSLPFRPLGGRKNSSMMFHLTTKKAPGVISGIQTGPGEHDITWSTELPETCLLSVGLKKLLTPLLAGLLEYNERRVLSFTKLFESSQSITTKICLHILWICKSSVLKVYLSPTDTFADLQESTASQTGLAASKQMFILNGEAFQPNGKLIVMDYPPTSESNPILLYSNEQLESSQISPPYTAHMPVLHPRFSTQNDYPIAKGAVTVGHILRTRQEEIHRMHTQFDHFVSTIENGLSADLLRLLAHNNTVEGNLVIMSKDIQTAKRILFLFKADSFLSLVSTSGQRNAQMLHEVNSVAQQLKCKLEFYIGHLEKLQLQREEASLLLVKISNERKNNRQTLSWKPSEGCSVKDNECAGELAHLIGQMTEIFQRFSRDRKMGKLSYNDEQIHKMEKLNLGDQMKQTKKCIAKCEDSWRQRHSKLVVWYNKSHSHRMQIEKADALLASLIQSCKENSGIVSDISAKCWQLVESQCSGNVYQASSPVQTEFMYSVGLENTTQTAVLPLNTHQPLTNRLDYHTQLTRGGQPLVLGQESSGGTTRAAPFTVMAGRSRHPVAPAARPSGASFPIAFRGQQASLHNLRNSSPAILVAHGTGPPRYFDSPSEIGRKPVSGDMAEFQGATPPGDSPGGQKSHMIRVSKDMKQNIQNFQKQSGEFSKIIQESSEVQSQFTNLSLDVELPHLDDSSLTFPTLTTGAEGGYDEDYDEDDIASLDIKRPPISYRSVSQ